MATLKRRSPNGILASISEREFATLQPYLAPVMLPLRKSLEVGKRKIEHVYFIEHGLASVVADSGHDHRVEVGVIGHEGMTGLSVIMATDIAPHAIFMQSAGSGLRMAASDLKQALKDNDTLRDTLLQYCHTMVVQMSYTALANGRYKVDERLARWLLMARDRSDSDTIHLTHDFLSIMLGCRRPSVTEALNDLAKKGAIRIQRGIISVLDRSALEEAANGSYGAPELEYRRLFPAVAVSPATLNSAEPGFAAARQ